MRKTENYQDDIIDQIRDFYKHHEEPYMAGSWESFCQYESQRRNRSGTKLWRKFGMAAAISGLICMGAWAVYHLSHTLTPDDRLTMLSVEDRTAKPRQSEKSHERQEASPHLSATRSDNAGKIGASIAITSSAVTSLKRSPEENRYSGYATLQAPDARNLAHRIRVPAKLVQRNTFLLSADIVGEKPFLPMLTPGYREVNQLPANAHHVGEAGSAWRFGLEVHSAVSDERLHFGGGMIAAYALTDRISLNSGISYLNLSGGYSLEEPMRISSSTSLLSVESRLAAIDIPLALTYRYGGKSQFSAGVSLLNVVSEQLDHRYAVNSVKTTMFTDMKTGEIREVRSTVTDYSTQEVDEQLLLGNTYLGFANLSWGREIGAFNRSRVLLAPYVKLPIGKLSKEEINLINVGVKLKFDF